MKLKTPDIDPRKALGNLDALANKVPEDIAKLLRKIAVALFVFFLIIAAYYGWTLGYGENNTEGLKIVEDQKSMFREDIEREYNRKRKNIRLSDIELDITHRAEERMLREEIARRSRRDGSEAKILSPSDKPLEDESSLYEQKQEFPFPLSPDERMTEILPGKDESNSQVLKRVDSLEREMEKEEERAQRLEKMIERLEKAEKKRELVKPR